VVVGVALRMRRGKSCSCDRWEAMRGQCEATLAVVKVLWSKVLISWMDKDETTSSECETKAGHPAFGVIHSEHIILCSLPPGTLPQLCRQSV